MVAVEERVTAEVKLLDSNVEPNEESDSDIERLCEVEATRSEKA